MSGGHMTLCLLSFFFAFLRGVAICGHLTMLGLLLRIALTLPFEETRTLLSFPTQRNAAKSLFLSLCSPLATMVPSPSSTTHSYLLTVIIIHRYPPLFLHNDKAHRSSLPYFFSVSFL